MSSRWLTDRPLRIDQKHVECFRRCLVRIQEGVARIIAASAGDHPPTWFLLADHLPEKDGHALAEAGLALLGIAAALHIYRLAAHGFPPNSPMRQISPSLNLSIQKRRAVTAGSVRSMVLPRSADMYAAMTASVPLRPCLQSRSGLPPVENARTESCNSAI